MNNLIEVEKFITQAKRKGIDFGKGDPYNRLRYYTKIGWLPHMVRKKDKSGNVKGHYPKWALDRLQLIEDLKNRGFSNDDIEKKIETSNRFQNITKALRSKETRNQIISIATLLVLLLIFTNELGIIRLGKPKDSIVETQEIDLPQQIIDSGTAFVPKDQRKIYIKNSSIRPGAKVYITFKEDYSPAVRYWVSDIEEFEGFLLELDTPVFNNTEFEWWISQ